MFVASTQFTAFLQPQVDRFTYLKALLKERDLKPSVVAIADSRHLLVNSGFSLRPRTVLVAHYDRAKNSAGANDNSAAVFQLMAAAVHWRQRHITNWLAVFTDHEEAASRGGAKSQGAYALAQGFKDLAMKAADFYILDACGCGDQLVISTTVDSLLRDSGAAEAAADYRRLRTRAMAAARAANLAFCLAPTPFSDDLGFLAAGIAAQTITVLPTDEAARWLAEGRRRPNAELNLLSFGQGLDDQLPATWQRLHSPQDQAANLESRAFKLMEKFLAQLVS